MEKLENEITMNLNEFKHFAFGYESLNVIVNDKIHLNIKLKSHSFRRGRKQDHP